MCNWFQMKTTSVLASVAPELFQRLTEVLEDSIQNDFNTTSGVKVKKTFRSSHYSLKNEVAGRGARRLRAMNLSEAEGEPPQQHSPDVPPAQRSRTYLTSVLANKKQINASLKQRRNESVVEVAGDGNCILHAVVVTAPEVFREQGITNHLQLREVLCNFLSRNSKTSVSSEITFNDLFKDELDNGGARTYNAYVTHLRKPTVYADVMMVYAIIHKFKVDVEVLDTLSGQYSAYKYFHSVNNIKRTILLVHKTSAYTFDDYPAKAHHTGSGEHYSGTKYLSALRLSSRSRSRENDAAEISRARDVRDPSKATLRGGRDLSIVSVREIRKPSQPHHSTVHAHREPSQSYHSTVHAHREPSQSHHSTVHAHRLPSESHHYYFLSR